MANTTWRRHFEGWQLGAIVVAVAALSAWLTVPRSVAPDVVPAPQIDRAAEAREAARDGELATAARLEPLSAEVRTVGERFRRYGLETSRNDAHGADYEQGLMRRKISEVLLAVGPEPLLQLRAIQTQLFVGAANRWADSVRSAKSATSEPNERTATELVELGGNFAENAAASGWVSDGHLAVSNGTLAALFRVRWSRLTGLDKHPFAPSLTDELLVARVMLERPLRGALESQPELVKRQLSVVAEVMDRQPHYPGNLARGVLLYRAGNYESALSAFTQHLELHADGPWTLRAANYRAAALKALGWLE